jgi:hypothetical protein
MIGSMVLATGVLVAFIFCAVRTVVDFRARRFGWAWSGVAVSALLLGGLVAPIQTHAVKVDLPING